MLSNGTTKIIVLGTAQDGGYPQTGCKNKCCIDAWKIPKLKQMSVQLSQKKLQPCGCDRSLCYDT